MIFKYFILFCGLPCYLLIASFATQNILIFKKSSVPFFSFCCLCLCTISKKSLSNPMWRSFFTMLFFCFFFSCGTLKSWCTENFLKCPVRVSLLSQIIIILKNRWEEQATSTGLNFILRRNHEQWLLLVLLEPIDSMKDWGKSCYYWFRLVSFPVLGA